MQTSDYIHFSAFRSRRVTRSARSVTSRPSWGPERQICADLQMSKWTAAWQLTELCGTSLERNQQIVGLSDPGSAFSPWHAMCVGTATPDLKLCFNPLITATQEQVLPYSFDGELSEARNKRRVDTLELMLGDVVPSSTTRKQSEDTPEVRPIFSGSKQSVDLSNDGWQLAFLPGRDVPHRYAEIYDKAYELWASVWAQTFAELDGSGTLYADDFLRRDEVVVLSHDNEPVALSLFHRLDLRRPAHRADSYFRPFPQSLLTTLVANGQHDVLIGSYFTLSPTFRKGRADLPVKDILFGAVTQRFVTSGAQLMLGIMRKDRGMHALGTRFGARPLLTDVCYHNVPVDLVQFTPANARHALASSSHRERVTGLWDARIDTAGFPSGDWFEDRSADRIMSTGMPISHLEARH
jgi:hypothetical protein